jgi:hypothetical protein
VHSLNTTKPTARRTMTELKATGLVDMYDVNPNEYNSEKEIHLKPEFGWFLSDKFSELRGLKEKRPPRADAEVSYHYPTPNDLNEKLVLSSENPLIFIFSNGKSFF